LIAVEKPRTVDLPWPVAATAPGPSPSRRRQISCRSLCCSCWPSSSLLEAGLR